MAAKEKGRRKSSRKDKREKKKLRKAKKAEASMAGEKPGGPDMALEEEPLSVEAPPPSVYAEPLSGDGEDVDMSAPAPLIHEEEVLEEAEEIPSDEEILREEEVEKKEKKIGWTNRLRFGLSRSRGDLDAPFEHAKEKKAIGKEFWEELEEALIGADVGLECASDLVTAVRQRVKKEKVRTISGVIDVLREEIVSTLYSFGAPPEPPGSTPRVLFIVGVNGVGKTTTAAKIGFLLKNQKKSASFAAADTFRAAGIEQMELWAKRVGLPVVKHKTGSDPAAVVFDAIESAKARGVDVVVVDTAGRLHTKVNLMAELNKMWRVADREIPGKPEAILVIDATTGQNGISQAELFSEALPVGSIALTKLDGTAKGGIILAIGKQMGIPVAYVGVGETLEDLHQFDPEEYAKALI